jgi:RNase P subunit RPR2
MQYKRKAQIKEQRKKIALERIEILESMVEKKPEFANRYRELIKRIKAKYRLQKDF